jgi:hypothetical protein
MFFKDPWPWQFWMQLALVITIPTLLIALCFSVAYERDICILMLDWLQTFESKRVKLSQRTIGRLIGGRQKALKSRG